MRLTTTTRRVLFAGLTLVAGLVASGCKPSVRPAPAGEEAKDQGITKTSQEGPVKATVSLSPKAPKLGDQLVLTLSVESEPQVSVEMPPFGEALGRFAIVGFTPRSSSGPDGRTVASQRYLLEAPMSGRQRIPSLRVEFTDRRPGQASAGPAGQSGSDGGVEREREVLTEELSVDIASVLPEGEVQAQLRGPRGPLQEEFYRSRGFRYGAASLGVAALVALLLLLGALRRRARHRARVSAFDVAMSRLQRLEDRGLPAPDEADAFYVELSDIVRHYVE